MAALPRNADVAEQFDLLADLLELEGAQSFRVIAYRRAATRMRETATSVAQLALDGKAKELAGIGRTIEEKIVQIVEQGEIEALTRKKAGVPPEVVQFMKLPGLGPKTAARIWRELGVTTLAELKAAAEGERLRTLTGLGAKSEEKILKALAFQAENPESGRRLLGEGLPAVLAVAAALREHPAAVAVSEAGSARRRKETFKDLDLIATATDPAELTAHFTQLPWVVDVAAHGDTKATVVSNEGLRFDLRVVPPESYGNLLQHFTGSKEHNVAMREDAVRRGLSISEYGVTTVETGDVFRTADEDALYEFLGYQPVPPELREHAGELEAARRGELPALVELGDVRGDLHTHSHWSADGKSTLEEMLEAAVARGYSYYAVTDHSHYLREGRLHAQLEEIERSARPLPEADDPHRRRGEHPHERRGRRRRGGSRAPGLGRGVGAPGAGDPADRARARGDAESVRRLHRPSHRPPDRQARPARRRRRARDRGCARDRARSSRSTVSPTGSTSATSTRAPRRRPA